MTLVIGLTGGVGSGKTTIAELFAQRGIPILDADVVAHQLTQPHCSAFASIVQHFKKKSIVTDGKLNRAELRKIIFEQPDERRWLENLLHPLILAELKEQVKNIKAPYCITVIPLLLEKKTDDFIDRVLVVDSPEHLQIARVIARDQTKQTTVEAMLKSQLSRSQRLMQAHDVIVNDGKLSDLIPQVEKLHQIYSIMGKSK